MDTQNPETSGTPANRENKPFLQIQNLEKTYSGSSEPVFDSVNFGVTKGEFVCIIGHSGCGKTTILNVLAGLESASGGHVFMDAREIAGPSLERGVVFQGHALMPWLTVRKNIAFAVRSKWPSWTAAQVDVQVEKYVALVGLTASIDKKPSALSGGMKQRVGIARALAMAPKVLLMDEPFGALDALTRAHLQDELLKIVAKTESTVVMVTHDVDEAVLLSDRIVMLTNGPAATIGEIVEVGLARPRERVALSQDPEYAQYRGAVLEFLYRKQAHPKAA